MKLSNLLFCPYRVRHALYLGTDIFSNPLLGFLIVPHFFSLLDFKDLAGERLASGRPFPGGSEILRSHGEVYRWGQNPGKQNPLWVASGERLNGPEKFLLEFNSWILLGKTKKERECLLTSKCNIICVVRNIKLEVNIKRAVLSRGVVKLCVLLILCVCVRSEWGSPLVLSSLVCNSVAEMRRFLLSIFEWRFLPNYDKE